MPKKRLHFILSLLYGCATLQFIRFYCQSTHFYLNMSAYLAGHERLPFQERVLPILFLRPLSQSTWLMQHLSHAQGIFTPELGPFYLLSLIAMLIAVIYTQRLYSLVTSSGLLSYLVLPIFLFTVMWTYSIHTEANYSYPYDLPSLAFFAAGFYYLYARRFLPFFLVVAVGTFNRETTLFLIVLYIIDSATVETDILAHKHNPVPKFDLRAVTWTRVLLLSTVWLAIKLTLMHHFAMNDASENFLRIRYNLHQLKPRLLPALLNLCGYTLPLVVLLRKELAPVRFRNYLWILPVWFAVMFCSGVILETRIYGELCPLAAVALVLIMESVVEGRLLEGVPQRPDPTLQVEASTIPAL